MSSRNEINRRDFLKLCGAAAVALSAPLTLVPLAEAGPGPGRFVETRLKMGTTVTLTLIGASPDQAREALDAAWAEMDRLIAVFDRHRNNTAVSALNAGGRLADPGPEFLEVLAQAREVHRLSDGAFDPTILPLLGLIESSFEKTGRPPEKAALTEALRTVDFGAVKFDQTGIVLGRPEQQISLDGVAKGYIVDQAAKKIQAAGITRALLNAGGDILALGRADTGRSWRIAVQDPFDPQKYARLVGVEDQAIATSGSYEVFYNQERTYHHLLDPKAGLPATALVSATTIAPTTALADALATAGFVNPDIYRTRQVQGLIITRNKRQAMTPGFKEILLRG
ncbi:MAG: FAD:protein FMN transferase [Thermodesulfobacteriota bacterium]